jgi:hypothetical protein
MGIDPPTTNVEVVCSTQVRDRLERPYRDPIVHGHRDDADVVRIRRMFLAKFDVTS